jgi:ribonuclease HII
MLVLGIDDAGRGPIIGPMVIAGCIIDTETELDFKGKGVKDSKLLSPKKRDALAKMIKEKAISYKTIKIDPDEIDSRTSNGTNLNHLEAIKMANIINALNKKKENIKVYIDCPSVNIESWTDYLKKYLENPKNLEIISEHKADQKYPVVSAASILAKTAREEEIKNLKKKLGVDFGSGYPADPVTCKFLQEHSKKHEKDGIFRKTWQTWKDLCGKKEQKKLF